MKNWKVLMTIIILLSMAALVTQSALAKEESISIARASLKTPTNETELVSFVESAVAHVKEVGKDRAIHDFMDLNGSWVRGDVYVFAHAFNGTTLALPFLPNAIGTNRLDIQDPEGRYINREMNCIALHGSGFYHYIYLIRLPIRPKKR